MESVALFIITVLVMAGYFIGAGIYFRREKFRKAQELKALCESGYFDSEGAANEH